MTWSMGRRQFLKSNAGLATAVASLSPIAGLLGSRTGAGAQAQDRPYAVKWYEFSKAS